MTPGYTRYIIPGGSHYASENTYRALRLKKLTFNTIFDSSCIYNIQVKENAGDINKLYGFSDCNTAHHENSARFGWRWFNDELQIFAYGYAGGTRHWKQMGAIPIGTAVTMSIALEQRHYVFELNGKTERLPRNCAAEYAEGYRLYPYFGGDEAAPHEIRIWIRELDGLSR
ncbi:MAG TPA: hypothetical protein VD996_11630 [Chitinophagaceae bacterium]|nr:hypothetical protein [Chitinophagaceae bacterium]